MAFKDFTTIGSKTLEVEVFCISLQEYVSSQEQKRLNIVHCSRVDEAVHLLPLSTWRAGHIMANDVYICAETVAYSDILIIR